MITPDQLREMMPDADSAADTFADPLSKAMLEFEINTPLREAAFLAQIAVESEELRVLIENLNYSAQALLKIFARHFTEAQAAQYGHKPEMIANRIYANRMGNASEQSGDGWKYRGRGLIQTTGKENYEEVGKALNLDLINHPELLEQPENAAISAGFFWHKHLLNDLADDAQFKNICIRINGGLNDFSQRLKFYHAALEILG
ncbi:MAG: glycoside hydrolase family 19 protein [Pseudomonadota bacterium]|nr:glycoside hydrolase family 19 protein [Pseudomonadota bacterium]